DVGDGFDGVVLAIAPAPDGTEHIYVGGAFVSYKGVSRTRIIRLRSDGSIDSTFESGSGFDGLVYAIAPTHDGSGDIYVGGSFLRYNGVNSGRIIRLRRDGSVNSSFVVGATGFDQVVTSIAVDQTG